MANNLLNASKDLTGTMTAKDIMDKVGLNWTTNKQDIFLANGETVHNHFAITRSDNGNQLGVVGNVYEAFDNAEFVQTLEVLASEKLATFKRGWCWEGGAKIGIVAEIPKHLYVLGKDELAVQITGINSFDGSSPVGYFVDVFRIICANGMKGFVKKGFIKARHSSSTAERLFSARKALGLAINSMTDILNQAELLARKRANADMVEKFLKGVDLHKIEDESTKRENKRFDLLRLFDRGIGLQDPAFKHSLWTLYNAATELVDHKNGSSEYEKKAVSSVYGAGASFKESALKTALELVNA